MSAVIPTSPTAGALRMVDGVLPMRAATMCLVTAFLEPATCTSPLRGPLGSMCQDGPALALDASAGGVMGERLSVDCLGRTARGSGRPWHRARVSSGGDEIGRAHV